VKKVKPSLWGGFYVFKKRISKAIKVINGKCRKIYIGIITILMEEFMFIWRGYGFLVPLITFLICLLMEYSLELIFFKGYYNLQKWPISLALFIAAIPVWFAGKRLNQNSERILLDPKTGEEVKLVSTHSFFWIRMEYWAPILAAIGIISFIK
jgi:hypothetical protein